MIWSGIKLSTEELSIPFLGFFLGRRTTAYSVPHSESRLSIPFLGFGWCRVWALNPRTYL